MNKLIYILLIALIASVTLSSCSEFQEVSKSTDINYKYDRAVQYFEAKDYYRAGMLFEELIPLFRGRKESELSQYYYAYCHYHQNQLAYASYYFESFVETYPRSEKVEECAYMNVKSLFYSTPAYNLDQSSTLETIGKIDAFMASYPNSQYNEECSKMKSELENKLELKSYHNAKIYHKLRYYKSAVIAIDNFLSAYPTTKFKEEMLFFKFDSQLSLAKISVDEIQTERYMSAIAFYRELKDNFSEGEYTRKAENLYDQALSGLNRSKENDRKRLEEKESKSNNKEKSEVVQNIN